MKTNGLGEARCAVCTECGQAEGMGHALHCGLRRFELLKDPAPSRKDAKEPGKSCGPGHALPAHTAPSFAPLRLCASILFLAIVTIAQPSVSTAAGHRESPAPVGGLAPGTPSPSPQVPKSPSLFPLADASFDPSAFMSFAAGVIAFAALMGAWRKITGQKETVEVAVAEKEVAVTEKRLASELFRISGSVESAKLDAHNQITELRSYVHQEMHEHRNQAQVLVSTINLNKQEVLASIADLHSRVSGVQQTVTETKTASDAKGDRLREVAANQIEQGKRLDSFGDSLGRLAGAFEQMHRENHARK